MRNILKHPHVLEQWLAHHPSFVFDYDGTLAPMFSRPMDAYMRPRTEELLAQLARVARVAVLTGRTVRDAKVFVGKLPLKLIVGNHGAEWSEGRSSRRRLSATVRQRVLACNERGVVIEDKDGFGMSVHYRHVPRTRHQAVRDFVDALPNVRVVTGHHVFNLLPRNAPDKGIAIVKMRKALGRERVVFVGDDVTDEFAFQLRAEWMLGIRVGLSRTSAASWYIAGQAEMDALLLRLVDGLTNARRHNR